MSLLIDLRCDRRLRAIRRANARSGLRRLLDLWYEKARIGLAAKASERAYEPRASRARNRALARQEPRQ